MYILIMCHDFLFRNGAHPDYAVALTEGKKPTESPGAITRIRGTETP